jgi:predicted RND superfamily exporter protein/outer membrane lipoprotein-sorting protein
MRNWIEGVVKYRLWVLLAVIVVTGGLASQIGKLRVEIDPNRFLPQSHPYVITSNRVEEIFGQRSVLVIGITPLAGDVYDPKILGKVERITRKLREDPGVLKNTILSFAARKAKSITGSDEGMEIRPLMDKVPASPAAMERLKRSVLSNPAYNNAIVSADGRSIAVIADFKDDPKGFRAIMERVYPIVEPERDGEVRIALGGLPVLLSQIEIYSERMGFFLPIAMLVVGLVLWLSFRSVQGLFLPLMTGILAVLWSLGIMSGFGVPLDVFNATTPILILAVASGHAVQILKRYYEEYERLGASSDDQKSANRQAVVESLTRIGPVMLVAGIVAAASFSSLVVFEISSVRTFGIFAACGILSSLALELSLIPAVRSMMRPPRRVRALAEHGRVANLMAHAADAIFSKAKIIAVTASIIAVVALVGASRVVFEDSFRQSFSSSIPIMQDDSHLNDRFGGTNPLYVMVEGKTPGRMQDPEVLRAIDGLQRTLEKEAFIGKTISIVDFIRRMNKAMHADDAAYDSIPAERDLVAQYLFLYSNGGDPGDFDTYVDYDYKHANVWAFLKEHDTGKLNSLVARMESYAKANFPSDVTVSFGGSVAQGTAIRDIIIRSKLLNMLQLAGVIFVLTALVFRSLVAGLLVLVPLAATVLFNFGVMGWGHIPFNIANSITAAMAVGIGADYVIYFLFRLREEHSRGVDFETAMRRTFQTAGSAIFFVAAATAAGYSVLLFSQGFWTHIWMGILISTAMITSALAALTLVPLLLTWSRPLFVRTPALAVPAASKAIWIALALSVGSLAMDETDAQTISAEDIMKKNYSVDKVVGSHSRVLMSLRNKQGQERVRDSITITKLQGNSLDNQRLVRFTAPTDVKGTAILLVEHSRADDDMWIYLPGLRKVRRLVASNKKDSFAGTDFSYGDVIGHSVEDWRHKLIGEEEVAGEACYVVESVPAQESVKDNSGYSKRRSWISKSRLTLQKLETWDTEGQLLKQAEYTDFRQVDKAGKWIAMRIRARNVQTGHQTEIVFSDYRTDAQVPDATFSARSLESGS